MAGRILDSNRNPQFTQKNSLKKGIKKFRIKFKDAEFKEMKKLYDRVVFEPVDLNSLTPLERKRAMESLIFIVEKRDGTVKDRTFTNSSTQRTHIEIDEAASPTVMTNAILIIAIIDAKQKRDIMISDIKNAFIQTKVPKVTKDGKPAERMIMKIRGVLVDMLMQMNLSLCEKYMACYNNDKVLCIRVLLALCGMLLASILYCKKIVSDTCKVGFQLNLHYLCVVNRTIKNQQIIYWHVDNIKRSHVDSIVNDEFYK